MKQKNENHNAQANADSSTYHIPVLLAVVIEWLDIKPDGI